MPPAKSSDPLPMEANQNLARKILALPNGPGALTSKGLNKARLAACLKYHPDKLGAEEEAVFSMDSLDQIQWACGILRPAAEEGDQKGALEKDKLTQIQYCFGRYFCEAECKTCLEVAICSWSCPGCSHSQSHVEQCGLKEAFSNCRDFEEQKRFYQISAHESYMSAATDLSKCHDHAAGVREAEAEIRAKHETERRKLQAQTTTFAKRQALMSSWEKTLEQSPYKERRTTQASSQLQLMDLLPDLLLDFLVLAPLVLSVVLVFWKRR